MELMKPPDTLGDGVFATEIALGDYGVRGALIAGDARATVELGSLTLELHHLPGHTPDTIVGFVPERGLLLMGDTAETPLPVVPPDSPLAAWIGGLERWEHDPRVRIVVPAHGPRTACLNHAAEGQFDHPVQAWA